MLRRIRDLDVRAVAALQPDELLVERRRERPGADLDDAALRRRARHRASVDDAGVADLDEITVLDDVAVLAPRELCERLPEAFDLRVDRLLRDRCDLALDLEVVVARHVERRLDFDRRRVAQAGLGLHLVGDDLRPCDGVQMMLLERAQVGVLDELADDLAAHLLAVVALEDGARHPPGSEALDARALLQAAVRLLDLGADLLGRKLDADLLLDRAQVLDGDLRTAWKCLFAC